MQRIEAYNILRKMYDEATEEQRAAISIAMDDIEFVDLMPEHYAPVVHGRWVPVPNTGVGATGRCTVCNKAIYGFTTYNYCPNCGARMDGE